MKRERSFTSGYGPLGRIYERLRKRSYRRQVEGRWGNMRGHEYYVRGVRDALHAVRRLEN